MNQAELSRELATKALRLGAKNDCAIFNKFQSAKNKDDLMEMYVEGIDFCLSTEFPSNECLKTHFGGVMENHGVYVDSEVDLVNPPQVVTLGKTEGDIQIDGYGVTVLYVKHQSSLKIKAGDNAFAMIDIFDEAALEIEASGNARVCVNRYGDAIVQHARKDNASIKIIEKHKKRY